MQLEIVTDRVPEIGFSGTQDQPKNEFKYGLRQVEQGLAFLHFVPHFWHIGCFFKDP